MNLLSVPVEVVDTCLLPYLGWNDLLRLRRTCKKFRSLTEDYMRRHPEKAPELEINEKGKNFQAFLAMGIPSKKIFLNNQSGNQFYNFKVSTFADQFLEDYGPSVTHLRVDKFSVWCTERGKQFLEGFTNLVSFQAAQTTLKRGRFGENPDPERTNLPTVFGRLQVLKLYQSNADNMSGVNLVLEELLRTCRSVEHFCIPFLTHHFYFNSLHKESLSEFFGILNSTVLQRNGEDAIDGQVSFSRVQSIEFSGYPDHYYRSAYPGRAFHQLCYTCAVNHVKLVNVRLHWFSSALIENRQFNRNLTQIGIPLVSLTSNNFSVKLTRLNMPNLTKLRLDCSHNWMDLQQLWSLSPCNLPMLKNLELTFDSGDLDSEAMCRYFFQGVVNEELTQLHITILMLRDLETDFLGRLADRLVTSCPRLKKLTISDIKGKCDALVAMLEAFETLEEVSFIACRKLKDANFVGPDAENPRFLRLTGLRKLSFIHLDRMPKLSDVLFSAVIRHMELTQLKITSSSPIRSVTLQGIESLLEGPFSNSVEKFSFKGWSLNQVSSEVFQALGKKFRCGNIV